MQNGIWEAWQGDRKSCCRTTPGRDRRATSVQFFALSWGWNGLVNGTPSAEPHSHSHHLTHDFRLLRIAQHPRLHRGKRMRLPNGFLSSKRTPAAGGAFASFHEVNWPLVFRPPAPV